MKLHASPSKTQVEQQSLCEAKARAAVWQATADGAAVPSTHCLTVGPDQQAEFVAGTLAW